jgi:hypothetical protein
VPSDTEDDTKRLAKVQRSASKDERKRLAKAKRLVRKPAMALLVTGILILVASLLGIYWAYYEWWPDKPVYVLEWLAAAVAAVVVFFSGFSMMQLRRYQLCIVGSIMVMPLVVTLPIGIRSLTALRTPGMRAAFKLNEELQHEESIAALDEA